MLIVEGWIKGGGYMNQAQNKEMTMKYMKKLTNIGGFLKLISFGDKLKDNNIFKEDWEVFILRNEEQEEKALKAKQKTESAEESLEMEKSENSDQEQKN